MPIISSSKLEHGESKTPVYIQDAQNTDQMTLGGALAQVEGDDFEFEPPRSCSLHKEIDLDRLLRE